MALFQAIDIETGELVRVEYSPGANAVQFGRYALPYDEWLLVTRYVYFTAEAHLQDQDALGRAKKKKGKK